MMRIGITGHTSFLGTHLKLFLHNRGDVEVVLIPRPTLGDQCLLSNIVSGLDALIHLAAVNRGVDEEIYTTNVWLAQNIVDACRTASAKPHILFASSVYAEDIFEVPAGRSNMFGPAKRAAEDLLAMWGKETGATVTILRLPHVFGEFAQPFHNSAVATFCHQLVHNEASVVNAGAVVELVYVGQVVARLYQAIIEKECGTLRIAGECMDVAAVYEHLKGFADVYRAGKLPQLANPLEVALFLTLHAQFVFSCDRPQNDSVV